MMKLSDESIIFDTSAIIKAIRKYPGYQSVESLFLRVKQKRLTAFIHDITFFEVVMVLGEKNRKEALSSITGLEELGIKTISTTPKDTLNAGLLRAKNPGLNLSTVDWLIIERAQSQHLTAITSDREWGKVLDVAVKIV